MQEDILKQDFKRILLKTFEDYTIFCKEHNLVFYAAFGTVLGAIRHGGLIPWDDDIDVYMPREDYNKLLSLRKDINDDYEIVDLENDGYYQDFAKFVNKKTTLIETKEIPFVCGIYIDIFPLDQWNKNYIDFGKDNIDFKKAFNIYFKSVRTHTLSSLKEAVCQREWTLSAKILTNIFYYQFKRKNALYKLNKCLTKFASIKGEFWCRYSTFPSESLIYPKDWFGNGIEMKFEHLTINLPKEYDKYLKMKYGDYMKLPPEKDRNSGHRQFYINLHERISFDEALKRKKNNPNLEIE